MDLTNQNKILKELKERSNNTVILAFSGGKDSVVCFDLLKKAKFKIYPVFHYHYPDLSFVNKTITMYEKHFGIKVKQLPHAVLIDMIRRAQFLPYVEAVSCVALNLPETSMDDMVEDYAVAQGLPESTYIVVGTKRSDSINRRMFIKTAFMAKKCYLINDFGKNQPFDYMRENKIPLSDDYKIFGRSFDGLKYHYLMGIKRFYPDDYAKIIKTFPLCQGEDFRYALYKKYYRDC